MKNKTKKIKKTLEISPIYLHCGHNSDRSPVISFIQNGNHKGGFKVGLIINPKMRYLGAILWIVCHLRHSFMPQDGFAGAKLHAVTSLTLGVLILELRALVFQSKFTVALVSFSLFCRFEDCRKGPTSLSDGIYHTFCLIINQ